MAAQTVRLAITGPEGPREFDVPEGVTIIGRSSDAGLVLAHPMISRRHAQITCAGGECLVTDLGSANGTLLNGAALTAQAPTPLAQGDRVVMGPFELTVQVLAAPEVEPEVSPAVEPPPVEPAGPAEPVEPTPPVEPPARPPAALPEPTADGAYEIPPGLSTHSQVLIRYLPPIYHTDFVSRFLALFEAVLLPSAWTVDNFDLYLSPASAPAGFLPWLANWYEIIFDDTWSETQRRDLLAEAGSIYARLGTRYALRRVLEIYTGCSPEIIEFGAGTAPHTFTVRLPDNGRDLKADLIERLIDGLKPAHTSYRLEIVK